MDADRLASSRNASAVSFDSTSVRRRKPFTSGPGAVRVDRLTRSGVPSNAPAQKSLSFTAAADSSYARSPSSSALSGGIGVPSTPAYSSASLRQNTTWLYPSHSRWWMRM